MAEWVTLTKPSGTRTGGDGSQVLRVTGIETSGYYHGKVWAQHDFVLSAGTEYRIIGWLQSDPTNEFDPSVWISRVDEGGADTEIYTQTGSQDWADFDETFTPTYDSYLRFGGNNGGAPAADFWFEFDDITLWATADEPTDPLLYWTAGGDAVLTKDIVEVYEGEQSLSVVTAPGDFTPQDANLDERYSTVVDAFVLHDSGNGVVQSRRLDPEVLS